MNVRDLGEFGLIERIRATLPVSGDLIVGPGDDAAVWRTGAEFTLATTDTMVDGVHFRAAKSAAEDVGWKALATNLSDIAAMGGTPLFALVTLCLPPSTETAYVDVLYAGIRQCAAACDVLIAGGDIVFAPALTMTIAVAGTAPARADGTPAILRRDAARPGDVIAVTGTLGASAAGLRLIETDLACDGAAKGLVSRHMRPIARVAAGRAAVASGVRCAIDVSDGLMQDIGHICEASGVAADLRASAIPVDAAAAERFPDEALTMALTGGEDYELVLVGPADTIVSTRDAIDVPVTVIGSVTDAQPPRVRVLDNTGEPIEVRSPGWDHFRAS